MSRHGRHSGEIAAGIGLASIAGVVGGTYKFAEFLTKAKRLHDVASENAVYVRIAQNVRKDLRETERLLYLREVKDALRTNPTRVNWIRDTMGRVRAVLEDMEKYTGRVEEDVDKKQSKWFSFGIGSGVSFRHRLRWVLDEHEKLENRTTELMLVHQSLMSVMEFLAQFEPLACCAEENRGGRDTRVEVDIRRDDSHDGFRDHRDRDMEVFREKEVYEEDERHRDIHRTARDRDLVDDRKIEMVDREVDVSLEAGYGYGGGDGPRRGSNIEHARRAYEFDEASDDRTVYETVRVREHEEPRHRQHHDHHGGAWVRKKSSREYDVRGGEHDREFVRERRVYREDDRHGHGREVIRERRDYEVDSGSMPLRTHWPSSRL